MTTKINKNNHRTEKAKKKLCKKMSKSIFQPACGESSTQKLVKIYHTCCSFLKLPMPIHLLKPKFICLFPETKKRWFVFVKKFGKKNPKKIKGKKRPLNPWTILLGFTLDSASNSVSVWKVIYCQFNSTYERLFSEGF